MKTLLPKQAVWHAWEVLSRRLTPVFRLNFQKSWLAGVQEALKMCLEKS